MINVRFGYGCEDRPVVKKFRVTRRGNEIGHGHSGFREYGGYGWKMRRSDMVRQLDLHFVRQPEGKLLLGRPQRKGIDGDQKSVESTEKNSSILVYFRPFEPITIMFHRAFPSNSDISLSIGIT